MIHNASITYFIIVFIVGALLIWWIRQRLVRLETRRKIRIKRLKRFESVETSTPGERPLINAKEAAVDSIENRFSIIRKITFFSVVAIWIIALCIPFMKNVPATFVSIMVASSGIIIGIASRPFIENLISGMVISFSHPLRIGDTIIVDGHYGYVEDITITHTMLKVWNWRRYIIPNSQMLSKEMINCTINDPYQWTHVEFYVAYGSNLDLIKEIAIHAAIHSEYFADYEDPRFWIMGMEDKGFKCWIAAWADSPADAWELGNDIRTELIKQFDYYGIKSHYWELKFNIDNRRAD